MVARTTFKVPENCLHKYIDFFLNIDNQSGIRDTYCTDLCNFILKRVSVVIAHQAQ